MSIRGKRVFIGLTAVAALTALVSGSAYAYDTVKDGVLTVGVEGTYPPITYHDESGELTGFDVEVAKAIGEKLGLKVQFVESEWDSLLASIDSGRIDTVINAVSVTDERKKKYDFTNPYVSLYRHVIVKGDNDSIKSLDDLKGKKVAENITTEYADQLEALGATIVPIDTMQQAFDLITSGRADFTLLEDVQFGPYMKEHPDADLKIAFTIDGNKDDVDQFAIPTKKGTDLNAAINDALNTLKEDGELGKLSEKYFDADVIDYDSIGGKKAVSGSDTEAETEGVSEADREGDDDGKNITD
ncbi:MAG: transporter substrate-binding domain-containing protein [Lachnospiraceae bacterium]|nr:transporter substrate-binding domain-containing protein [Lachnospiraceae bacterium]